MNSPRGSAKSKSKVFSYFKVFIGDHGVAAITPSSRFLVNRVMRGLQPERAKDVIEYGAAQGVMTRRILQKMPSSGKLLAIELNKDLFESLGQITDARLKILNGDVRSIDAIAAQFGMGSVDAIASGVPFAFLAVEERRQLLEKTVQLLRPGGRFVAYQVTTHLIPLLRQYFKKVKIEFEIRNLPPHFVFTAYK
ncbi:MAG: class I SAM-dependent methyltransferase [Elusimicrobiota bacterium]